MKNFPRKFTMESILSIVIANARNRVWHLTKKNIHKIRFCLYIGPSLVKFWLHTFQSKLGTKTPSTKFLSVCLCGFRKKLLTIHVKTAEGIIMKFHIWIRCLLTYVFSYIRFLYFDPKRGFGEGALMDILK